MSDFVEVIRRAVDGLKENTPERRAKVYEKARTAVVRQLENMKPAPPAAMLQRQIEKLDLAIATVEQEHAEALPVAEPEPPVSAHNGGIAVPASPSHEMLAQQASEAKSGLSQGSGEPLAAAEFEENGGVAHAAASGAARRGGFDLDEAHNNLDDIINDLTGRKASQEAPAASASKSAPRMPKAADELDLDFGEAHSRKANQAELRSDGSPEHMFGEEGSYSDDADVEPAFRPASSSQAINGYSGSDGDFDDEAVESDEPATLDRIASRSRGRKSASEEGQGNVRKIIIAAVCVLVLAGAGVAAWLTMSGGSETKTAEAVETSTDTNAQPAENEQPASESSPQSAEVENQPAPVSTDGQAEDAGAQKFTQRLMADGSEVDSGAASSDSATGGEEGRSVSEQSSNAPAGSSGAQQETAVPSTNGAQKMLLYEEKLGQSAPTAIPGTVTWSLQQEASDDGRAEPTIQGQLSVPDKGLSALITIKRNDDSSLPASHLIELVFSLPDNFEGGGIESVQRIAMKKTEQDRGNALVAVPAKITDDFHMVALNDYEEAKKANLELLRTRDWIDIPITYRNGRRALLTLEKGDSGKKVFDEALGKWATMGVSGSGSN